MPRIVMTHEVEDVEKWADKPSMDILQKALAPFATEVVAYVAVDGSNQIAVSANVHNMEGMMAFSQTPKAAANMEKGGVIVSTLVTHIEPDPE